MTWRRAGFHGGALVESWDLLRPPPEKRSFRKGGSL
jgi:hypothetical protein